MTRRVFILERDTRHDISGASRYGSVLPLFNDGERQPSIWSQHFADQIMSRLERNKFDQYVDYVLVAGQQVPVVLFVATCVAAYSNVNLLLFDSVNGEYVHKAIT